MTFRRLARVVTVNWTGFAYIVVLIVAAILTWH
jgi:hypothetical protein